MSAERETLLFLAAMIDAHIDLPEMAPEVSDRARLLQVRQEIADTLSTAKESAT